MNSLKPRLFLIRGKDGSTEGRDRERSGYCQNLTTSYLSSGCPGCLSKSGALRSNIRSDGALPLPRAFRSRVKLFTEFWVTHAYPH